MQAPDLLFPLLILETEQKFGEFQIYTMIFGLSAHSVFEGLAIGLQET